MCYLKDLMLEQNLDINCFEFKEEQSPDTLVSDSIPILPQAVKCEKKIWSPGSEMIFKLLNFIDNNNRLITKINQSITPISQQVEKITINFEKKKLFPGKKTIFESEKTGFLENIREEEDSICQRLFGKKYYKYALEPLSKFQETIHKERNFNISVRLVDGKGKLVENTNLLTLCFSICTMEGDWILENRVGDPLIKGRTQKDLLKGEAQFEKLYVREVSRIYPGGKVMIVIYPKQSSLKYSGEECIDSQQIKPLMIPNILIRAKRKQ